MVWSMRSRNRHSIVCRRSAALKILVDRNLGLTPQAKNLSSLRGSDWSCRRVKIGNDKARRPYGQPGFEKAPCDGALAPSSEAG